MYLLSRFIPQLVGDGHDKTKWLDGLRGAAAALVALTHAPLVIINLHLTPQVFYFSQSALSLFKFFGIIGVQIFFCITGALFTNKVLLASDVDWTSYFRKRLLRLTPAYVAAATLALVVAALHMRFNTLKVGDALSELPNIFTFGLTPLPTIDGFDFGRLLGVNWSLAYEWRYYVILPFVFLMIQRFRVLPCALVIIAFAIGDLYLTGNSSWVYFVSGAISAPLMYREVSGENKFYGFVLTMAVVIVYIFSWSRFPAFGLERWVLMTLLFMSITISKPNILTLRPFVAMGTVSYSFYLLHAMTVFIVFKACHKFVRDVTLLSFWSFTILVCLALAAAASLATISYLKVERPFMRLSDNGRATSQQGKNQAQPTEASSI